MTRRFLYLEQCRDLHLDITSNQIELDIKPESDRGSEFSFRSIGSVGLANGEVCYLGEKIYVGNSYIDDSVGFDERLKGDLFTSCVLVDRCPEIIGNLPRFEGWTTYDGRRSIIIEDASSGGDKEVWPCPLPQAMRAFLTSGFEEFGRYEEVFSVQELERRWTTCFDVEGTTMLLDLTPVPFLGRYNQITSVYRDLREEIENAVDTLRFDIPGLAL